MSPADLLQNAEIVDVNTQDVELGLKEVLLDGKATCQVKNKTANQAAENHAIQGRQTAEHLSATTGLGHAVPTSCDIEVNRHTCNAASVTTATESARAAQSCNERTVMPPAASNIQAPTSSGVAAGTGIFDRRQALDGALSGTAEQHGVPCKNMLITPRGIHIDRSVEMKVPLCCGSSDVPTLVRPNTLASVEFTRDAERGVDLRNFGTQVC